MKILQKMAYMFCGVLTTRDKFGHKTGNVP